MFLINSFIYYRKRQQDDSYGEHHQQ